MTREYYKNQLDFARSDRLSDNRKADMLSIVDLIIDDFESRTCGNCEYAEILEQGYTYSDMKCSKGHGNINEFGTIFTTKDFGCNKFVKKER